jgi:protein involved in temperature-dependent protein secretion
MSATANDIQRLLAAGRTADAEEVLRRKLGQAPANAEWRTLLARLLVVTGRQ